MGEIWVKYEIPCEGLESRKRLVSPKEDIRNTCVHIYFKKTCMQFLWCRVIILFIEKSVLKCETLEEEKRQYWCFIICFISNFRFEYNLFKVFFVGLLSIYVYVSSLIQHVTAFQNCNIRIFFKFPFLLCYIFL